MIGYYVHHQGRGHLHRAQALAAALNEEVTGLSSFSRPADWHGGWVELPRDDEQASPYDVSAGGQLHWAPVGEPGLRARSAAISAWLEEARPRLVVVDVSVEVALLVRLHGVPVLSVVLPGRRTDPVHLLGFRASSALVAFSPPAAEELAPDLPADIAARVVSLGAVSRYAPATGARERSGGSRHVVVLMGKGGESMTRLGAESLRSLAPGWRWTVLGGPGGWVDDVSAVLRNADVVVTNAGQSALADIAAHRRPAVVIPAERPFDEQATTAAMLERGDWPAIVLPEFPRAGWPGLLERASRLDGRGWQRWCDGQAAHRFARVVADAARRRSQPRSA
ncbi:glycosyltransferase [Pimelobacter simplex]|uniref:glycosyltransferase n=1 Tax=Nocardioides simplex TaxID=2045 RepID=UPI001933AE12|nr:glycosyl transferase [Pimelobacter simplex]